MDKNVRPSASQTNIRKSILTSDPEIFKSPPKKSLSIFLPSVKRNSIVPIFLNQENEKSFMRKQIKHLTRIQSQNTVNYIKKSISIDFSIKNFENLPYIPSNNTILMSNRMGESDYFENGNDLNFKDLEEKALIYQQIKEIIMKDDNEDFDKRVVLMDEKNDDKEYWRVDPIEDYQKKADLYSKLQEEQQFLYCEKKNPFELIKLYADPYPLLETRKTLAYFTRKVSVICNTILKHPAFDSFVLFIILWNCVLLAIEDPTKQVNDTEALMEKMLLICYSIEMSLKILGLGFICDKNAYLRDGWNVLDFIIIVTSYLPYIVSNENDTSSFKLSSLRTLRVLRPLRTISSVKSLKNILVTLFSSVPLLLDILLFLLFFFATFAMIGVHLYGGVLKNRCFIKETGILESIDEICGYQHCPEESFCGKGLVNPYYGVMNFDNIFFSLVMGFQCVTLQAWTVIMVEVIKGYSIYSVVYFVSLVFFGSFFLLNLTLAVIKSKFTDAQKLKELFGKEVMKKISEVQMDELRLFKRMERTHFKRMKNLKQGDHIGASEEGRSGTSRFNEITWDDLLQLKEMIREEKLRAEEEQQFQMLRREEVVTDDFLEEKKLLFYMQKVQNMKKKALKLFLKKGLKKFPKNGKNTKIYPFQEYSYNSSNDNDSQNKDSNNNLNTRAITNAKKLKFSKIYPHCENTEINNEKISLENETNKALDFEDPSILIENERKPSKIPANLSVTLKELKSKTLVKANFMLFQRRQSIKTFPSLTCLPSFANSEHFFNQDIDVNPIEEEIENEEQENLQNQNSIKKDEKIDFENDQKSSHEADLLNDSDFNDSFTLNKAKLEAMLKNKPHLSDTIEPETPLEEEGQEAFLTERPFLKDSERNEKTETTGISMQPLDRMNQAFNSITSLKKSATSKKVNNLSKFSNIKMNNKINGEKKNEDHKRPNVRDFNLMVDMEKKYISYSTDEVLENRIIELAVKKKKQEMKAIHEQNYKIELKPSSFQNLSKEVLEQIRENRRKNQSMKKNTLKGEKINIALKKSSLFRRIDIANVILSKPFFYPQNSFVKSSNPRSPKRASNKKKKNFAIKLENDLEFSYDSLQRKINEPLIIINGKDSIEETDPEVDYLKIHGEDKKNEKKNMKVWSGSEVLPLRIYQGLWNFQYLNDLFSSLSFSKQDTLIWLPNIAGQVFTSF